jgi:hypothetical protein
MFHQERAVVAKRLGLDVIVDVIVKALTYSGGQAPHLIERSQTIQIA